ARRTAFCLRCGRFAARVGEVGPLRAPPGRARTVYPPAMSEGVPERRSKRMVTNVRRLNRHPKLVAVARGARERAMGDDHFVARLSPARGRPADLAARQLVALRGEEPGLLGELG